MFEFFKMVVDKDVTRALASVNIIYFCDPMTHRMVEDGIEKLDRKKVPHFLEDIFDDITI